MRLPALLSSFVLMAHAVSAKADLIFSANDQRSGYSPAGMFIVPQPGPGSLTVLDFSSFPPRVANLENVPCSVIGPPTCIAANADGSTILLAAAMQVNPEKPNELAPDRKVTRLQWRDGDLKILDQIDPGLQPSGIAFSPKEKLAFVTLRAEGKVAVLDMSGPKMAVKKTVGLATPEDSLSQLVFSPDGQTALASLHAKNTVLVLDRELNVLQELSLGKGPYDINFLPNGQRALVACTKDDALYWLTREGETWKVGERIPVGKVPEGLDVSADGKWIAASCFEGANSKNKEANPARVHILSIGENYKVTPTQKLAVKGIPQSAVFTTDGKYLVVGQFGESNLVIYQRDGEDWKDTGTTIPTPGQPAALAAGGSGIFP
jgi:6-phosphogluconolactonase (cycloisomerase 2 family)